MVSSPRQTFNYTFKNGEIEASKSLMNRMLIIDSFNENYSETADWKFQSSCEDVFFMRNALAQIVFNRENELVKIDCGAAGTVLRFIAFRVARERGCFLLKGAPELLRRPQQELVNILENLGVKCELKEEGLLINSSGWGEPKKKIIVDSSVSSQFASGLLLSAWRLPFNLEFNFSKKKKQVSSSYWQMSLQLVQKMGMEVVLKNGSYTVVKNQFPKVEPLLEIDMSSCFAFAALGAVSGYTAFEDFPKESLQPDFTFVEVLPKMNACFEREGNKISIRESKLKAIDWDLTNSPDLFPVLAVLCALSKGTSRLYGASHLRYKESSRIDAVSELLTRMNCPHEKKEDGMIIRGIGKNIAKPFIFNPQNDHRMVMASMVAFYAGFKLTIETPEVIKKSINNYWNYVKRAT